MSPKSLLRHKECVSTLEDMSTGSRFRFTISERDEIAPDDKVKKLVFCSGKVYYELRSERAKRGVDDMALVTLEQISPFPFRQVIEDLKKYPNAEVIWCQEEPMNNGAWSYVEPRMMTALKKGCGDGRDVTYIGRNPAAAPGTGLMALHLKE